MSNSTFAADPTHLSPEWLTHALKSTGAITGARVTSYDAKIIGEGAGFMGQLAKLSLDVRQARAGRARVAHREVPGRRAGEPRRRDVLPLLRARGRLLPAHRRARCSCARRAATSARSSRRTATSCCCSRTSRPRSSATRSPDCTAEHVRLADPRAGEVPGDVVEQPGARQARVDAEDQRRVERRGGRAELRAELGAVLRVHRRLPDAGAARRRRALREEHPPLMNQIRRRAARRRSSTATTGSTTCSSRRRRAGPSSPSSTGRSRRAAAASSMSRTSSPGRCRLEERRAREREIVKLYHDTLVENGVQGLHLRPVLGGLPALDAVPAGVLRHRRRRARPGERARRGSLHQDLAAARSPRSPT